MKPTDVEREVTAALCDLVVRANNQKRFVSGIGRAVPDRLSRPIVVCPIECRRFGGIRWRDGGQLKAQFNHRIQ